jgi:PAS domain S-box-containing protein
MREPRSPVRVGEVSLAAGDDLQTQREKLARIVLDGMYQFVGLLDADGMTLEINRAALEGSGQRIDDIRGKPFWEARWFQVSKEVADAQRDYVRRAQAGEFIRCDTEVYGRAAGEETIVVDFSLLPVKDDQGRVVFLLAEGRNITEKKRAEAEVARKNAELQTLLDRIRQLDQLKSDLFANVSHELRTPLALILGPAEDLLADPAGKLDARQRDSLHVIQRSAATLLKHVNDLLDLAKHDAHQLAPSYSRIDLAARFREVAEPFRALAAPRALAYVVVAPPRLVAEVDADKFERVLLNLLSNAFKFTPAGGRIRCELRAAGSGQAGGRALLVVQDSGPGIAPDMRQAVFERFRQGQTGTTRDFGGTGLGLAIAKEFVDLHGGTIGVTQAPGGGAMFQVELPCAAPPGSVVADGVDDDGSASLGRPGRHLQGALAELSALNVSNDAAAPAREDAVVVGAAPASTVLVVEDNDAMRRFIADALAAEHRVQAVADGEQALAAARRAPPDLVVTDLMMPRLGGDRLVESMRADPALADTPVLVVSAKDDAALRARLLDARVQDYVTKPFSAQELRARVRNLTTMKLARDALRRELASHSEDLTHLTHELIGSRRALQASEQRWQAMFQHSPVGIVLADGQGRIRSANPAMQAMLGYAEQELRRITLMRVTPVEDRAAAQARLDKVLSGELREVHVQRRFQNREGGLVWANTSVACVPQGEAGPPFVIVVAEDVTERRRAEEALARARNELARVTRASTLGELAASIAHEVNQPLAAIVANGQACERWLDRGSAGEHEARQAVQRIVRDANRAGEVVARVRRLLRQGELQRELIAMDQVVDEVLDLIRMEALTSRIALLFEPPRGLPEVRADRVQVQQILLNLLMNAMEAILARSGGARWVEVLLSMDGGAGRAADALRVDVRDSGIGLPAQDVDRVFDAFHTTKPGGMGMGLAISRSIVEAHGGRMWVDPGAPGQPGAGATFSFTLPREAP